MFISELSKKVFRKNTNYLKFSLFTFYDLPKNIFDFNKYKSKCIEYDKNSIKAQKTDHPSFTDNDYRIRREHIGNISDSHRIGDEIPYLEYTKDENEVWKYMFVELEKLYYKNACDEYLKSFEYFKYKIGMNKESIPQLRDISKCLSETTGFIYEPVSGLLEPRYFLNGLAFKIFHGVQYVRPALKSEFSGEPDIMHDILGHTPMLCNKDFADFIQEIGIASLFANEEQIKIISNIYWFCVEFGLIMSKGKLKVFGAGILGSPFEMNYAIEGKAKYHELDFDKMQNAYYDYTSLSTNYFVSEGIELMKKEFLNYIKNNISFSSDYHFDKENNEIVSIKKIQL